MASLLNLLTGGLLGKAVDGIVNLFKGAQETRQHRATIDAKIQLARVDKESKLELAGHELQVIRTQNAGGTWKDEYVTLLVSIPILVSAVGSLVTVAHVEIGARLIRAAGDIADIMTGDVIGYPELWMIVVTTALGTKALRR